MRFRTPALIAATALMTAVSWARADVVLLSDSLGNAANPSRTTLAGSTASGGYTYSTSQNVAYTPDNGYVATTTVNPSSTTVTEIGNSSTNYNTSYTVGFTPLRTAGLLSLSMDISSSAGFAYMGFTTKSATGSPLVDPTSGNMAGIVLFGPASQLGGNVQLHPKSSVSASYSGTGFSYLASPPGVNGTLDGTTTYHLLLTLDPATDIIQTTLSALDGTQIWQSAANPVNADGPETLSSTIPFSSITGISFGIYGYSAPYYGPYIDSATFSNLLLTEAGTALTGDANLDGRVDLSDLAVILNNFGKTSAAWTDGNFDGSSTIDSTDLSSVLNNFGAATTATSAHAIATSPNAIAPAPEPASLGVLAIGALLLARRRHCQKTRA